MAINRLITQDISTSGTHIIADLCDELIHFKNVSFGVVFVCGDTPEQCVIVPELEHDTCQTPCTSAAVKKRKCCRISDQQVFIGKY